MLRGFSHGLLPQACGTPWYPRPRPQSAPERFLDPFMPRGFVEGPLLAPRIPPPMSTDTPFTHQPPGPPVPCPGITAPPSQSHGTPVPRHRFTVPGAWGGRQGYREAGAGDGGGQWHREAGAGDKGN